MPTIILSATLEALAQVTAFVAEQAVAAGFLPERVMEIELAIEEMLTNICNYADCGRAALVPFDVIRSQAPLLDVTAVEGQDARARGQPLRWGRARRCRQGAAQT